MHIIRNSILCFVMVSVFVVQKAESQTPATSEKILKTGIGFQLGVRFHQPDQVNQYITDLNDAFLQKYIYGPIEKKSLGPGVFFGVNGIFDIGPFFSAIPFAQSMWAGKQMYFTGGPAANIHVNTYTAMGGLNLWVRVVNLELFRLRIGAGAYATYTYLSTTGDVLHRRIRGSGAGGRALLGTEFRLTENTVLTFDCGVPFGKSKLYYFDPMEVDGIVIKYPKKLDHLGFELSPGIVFYF